ncbi:MAG: hypothetical protein JNM00_12900 [Flavobacteriales bacterium]|nr:hypothetical protein [Flavobacteriales bacterium]
MKIKNQIITLLATFCSLVVSAQVPHRFNYQCALRDANGEIAANDAVTMRFTIRQNNAAGAVRYQEIHTTTSNEFGLVNVDIGAGTVTQFSWSNLDWISFTYVLQVEADMGLGFIDMGTSAFDSVPFALLSEKSTNMAINDLYDVETYMGVNEGDILRFNADENWWEPGRPSLNDLSDVNFEEFPQHGDQLIYSDYFAEWVPSSVAGALWHFSEPDVSYTTNQVGIGTDDPETALAVHGFTQLGENAPKIKMITLSANYSSGFNPETYPVPHGLPDITKIISVSMVKSGIDTYTNVPSDISYEIDDTNFTLSPSTTIFGGTVKVTILYTQ